MKYYVHYPDGLGYLGFYIPSYLVNKYQQAGYIIIKESGITTKK